MSDQGKLIDEMWSIDGPFTTESVLAAAETIDQLWRYLGRAFAPSVSNVEPVASLENPRDFYALVGSIVAADLKASAVLARLGHWSNAVGNRAAESGPDQDNDASNTVFASIGRQVCNAASTHATAAEQLNTAHFWLDRAYWKSQERKSETPTATTLFGGKQSR